MRTHDSHSGHGLDPGEFLSEVREFRTTVADPGVTRDEKKRAYGQIIHHAALVDPLDAGFANVGVALKDALLLWLDAESTTNH